MYSQSQVDLLDIEVNYIRASAGKRFGNYIIDIIFFYVVFTVIVFLLALFMPESINYLLVNSSEWAIQLIALIFYSILLSAIEALFNGKTLGKLLTGTRAVNLDGSSISVSTAFKRGFSRALPFCGFSALGSPCNPWQDSWTDTMVIDEKSTNKMYN